MTPAFRAPGGGSIDRAQALRFSFDGRDFTGFAGDTLASALLANGVHLAGRSFKYHRPRGIMAAGSEEPNALVTVDRGGGRITPNLRATQIELYEGLRAVSQNRFPSLAFDLGAIAGTLSPVLSAGFYYKTFMWPPSFWRRVYEPAIRAAAGLGRAPDAPDPDHYAHQYAHCDVLIIGAGPAGLAAALAASNSGARVILCDEQASLGGSLLTGTSMAIDGWPAREWLAKTLELLTDRVTLLPRTTAFGWYPDNLIGLAERVTDHLASPDPRLPRERLWHVRAGRVVIAAGAIERPLVFPGNDRPGIMLAGAARTYLDRYGVRVGSRAAVAASHDGAWHTAVALHEGGIAIAGIIDPRATVDSTLQAAARARGIPIHLGMTIAGTEGRMRVHTAKLSDGTGLVPCDTILMSGGWTPAVHLFSQSRGRLRYDAKSGTFLPDTTPAKAQAAGACAGIFGLANCLASGFAAGGGAARQFDVTGDPPFVPGPPPRAAPRHARAFVDFQNDVTTRDLLIAADEGFEAIEHVKRYTTAGMATDQGKTSNLNAAAQIALYLDRPMPAVGTITFRPPYTPVTFGTLAGAARGPLFDPVRHAPLHAWAVDHGAVFEDAGAWKRARYFPRPGEDMGAAVARECRAVRGAAGVLDASTLGKIEVTGPDAGAFLDRMYTGAMSTLGVGRCRYALLLGEDGFIRDDGVVARLAADRYHVTTTTGGAARVLHHMEDYRQTEFPELRVWLTSVTEHWAVIAVQGPRAGDVIAPLADDIDLGAMPHMSVRLGRIAGVPARLFRVSFTGERGFEINVPAAHAETVWEAVMGTGAPYGITPYGTEAMHVLRAEKGFIIVGQETDGTVIPGDLGLDWMIAAGKPDFVGKRSLARPDMTRDDRLQLVGLLTEDPSIVLEEGARVIEPGTAGPGLGHVTSAYWSATLGRSIALALVAGGRARIGSVMTVPDLAARRWAGWRPAFPGMAMLRRHGMDKPDGGGGDAGGNETSIGGFRVTVTAPVFFDPDGDRLRAAVTSADTGGAAAFAAIPFRLAAAGFSHAAVRLHPLAPTTRLSIQSGPAAASSIGRALGVLLPTVPCRAVTARDRAALWLGPDEWLVLAPLAADDLVRTVMAALDGAPASVVDVSHRTVAYEITGPRAAWCLNAFCALDLDQRAFPIGMCTRTLLGKAEIVLWRTGGETFHIETARSLAPYVRDCLAEAAQEVAQEVTGEFPGPAEP